MEWHIIFIHASMLPSQSEIGIGYFSFCLATLIYLKSIQTIYFPFFLRTGIRLYNHSTYQTVIISLSEAVFDLFLELSNHIGCHSSFWLLEWTLATLNWKLGLN